MSMQRADVVLVDDHLHIVTGVHTKLVKGRAVPGYRVQALEGPAGDRDVPADAVTPTGLPRPRRASLADGTLRLGPGLVVQVGPALYEGLQWELKYAYR